MWWCFEKLKEDQDTFTYSYGVASKELTGVLEYDLKAQKTKIIKYANNHTETSQKAFPVPVYHLIVTHGAPDKTIIAIG